MSNKLETTGELQVSPLLDWSYSLVHYFVSPALLMLVLGALGSRLHIPLLQHLGYWDCWLVVFGIQVVAPVPMTKKWTIKELLDK